MKWDTVIGLEVHAQLQTKSKLFSGSAVTFGAEPNTHTSFIDAGFPGTLPVLNRQAVHLAIKFGLAIQGTIHSHCYFERKNYFYPDLPKGYQISQYQAPIISNGQLEGVDIVRAHLEEDAGKSIHDAFPNRTAVDLNRAGTPLLEIVTAPCLRSADEVLHYLKALHQLLRFLNICDGNMQEGSFRCDVNISLKPSHSAILGTKVELKNLNSFRFIEKAIAYEQVRQQELLEQGQIIIQETRSFCPDTETTSSLRTKENEMDYRYFPDPDLLPLVLSQKQLEHIAQSLPPMPWEIQQILIEKGLPLEDIQFLLSSSDIYNVFDSLRKLSKADEKLIVNWLKRDYSFETPSTSIENLATLLDYLQDKVISYFTAKQIFSKLSSENASVDALVKQVKNKQQNVELEAIVQQVVDEHPQQVKEYRQGKEKLLAFFVGQVMKKTKGQRDPSEITSILKKMLPTPAN